MSDLQSNELNFIGVVKKLSEGTTTKGEAMTTVVVEVPSGSHHEQLLAVSFFAEKADAVAEQLIDEGDRVNIVARVSSREKTLDDGRSFWNTFINGKNIKKTANQQPPTLELDRGGRQVHGEDIPF